MKKPMFLRMVGALVGCACLLAANQGWSAVLSRTFYARAFWSNPFTGESSAVASPDKILMWGFSEDASGATLPTVPGPQINVGPAELADGLEITLHNELPEPISLVIPGLTDESVDGAQALGNPALFPANDPDYADRVQSAVPTVPPGAFRTYKWTNLRPGTFLYHSGAHPALQVQMGLFGMLTVKSVDGEAYPGITIGKGGEVSVIFSEIDPVLHQAVADGDYGPNKSISSTIHSAPSIFLINGRAHVDGVTPALEPSMTKGWTTLFRFINVGWKLHIPVVAGPHPSGAANYLTVVAEDAQPYSDPRVLYAPPLSPLKTLDAQFKPGAEGDYQVFDRMLGLGNGGGMFRRIAAVSGEACLPPTVSGAPVITTTAPVFDGDTVSLSLPAPSAGTAPFSYQWRKDGVLLSNGGYVSGVNTPTLTLTSAPAAASGQYDVVVANGCESIVSPALGLAVLCRAVANVVVTPATQTVPYGTLASFTVTATGAQPMTYQWRKGTVEIPGATTSTLSFIARSSDAGNYSVVISNPCGSQSSPAATLGVGPCLGVSIASQPVTLTAPLGGTASFSVAAAGSPGITYRWQHRVNLNWTDIPGATGSSLTLSPVTAGDFTELVLGVPIPDYRVVVANDCGSMTSTAVSLIECTGAPQITVQPASQGVTAGSVVSLTVTTSGTQPRTFQWRKNGVNLVDGANISGATGPGTVPPLGNTTSSTLTISSFAAGDAGGYDVVASNGCGSSVGSTATLTLVVRPVAVRSVVANRSSTATGGNVIDTPAIQINGNGKLLIAAITYRDTAAPAPTVASVTLGTGAGAPAFTQLATGPWNNSQGKVDLWYLVAPADSAAGTVVRVRFSGTTSMEQIAAVVGLYNGVNQATPFGAVLTDYASGARSNVSLSPASTVNDLVINWTAYNNRSALGATYTVSDGGGSQSTQGVANANPNLTIPVLFGVTTSASMRVTSKPGELSSASTTMSESFSLPVLGAQGVPVSMGAVALKPQ